MKRVNRETGLTDIQEKAIELIVSGKSKIEVAKDLKVDRSTLYNWSEKIAFQAYYNRLKKEIQDTSLNKLVGLYDKAVLTISKGLDSDNENVRMKTAFWLVEKIDLHEVGDIDPREMLKSRCYNFNNDDFGFDHGKYERLLNENGLR